MAFLKKVLNNIRQKDEAERKALMWVFVFFSMLIFIFIWLFSLNLEFNKLKAKGSVTDGTEGAISLPSSVELFSPAEAPKEEASGPSLPLSK